MNILISAGGTRERIDSVRGITNIATGRLGSLIAACFDKVPETKRIFYICGTNAPRPESAKAEITVIEDTADLERAVRELLQNHRVDAIIHSMAVSDYRVRTVTTPARIAEAARTSSLADAFENAPPLGQDGKISSDENRLVIVMEPTPKIISLFHSLAPHALLVGFKLLDNVSREDLINVALKLLEKNHCAFVLANDARDIHNDSHIAYLVDRGRRVQRFEDKCGIALGITENIIEKLKPGNAK
ncbi:MAG: phosphopantothenoylcysteine synthase [Treponema sp.]|jgi:phosphopantothenate-cysteine ligase|nr:phosphopantothenoylcysteine synthase [Treponema sp.]